MKALLTTLALALVVTLSSFTNNDNNTNDNKKTAMQTAVYPTATGKLNVIVDNATNRKVAVRVLNQKGQVLAEQNVGKSQKPTVSSFDLSALEDGVYQVEISNGETKETRQVTLKTNQPTTATYRTIAMN